jgi:hypothetical protein
MQHARSRGLSESAATNISVSEAVRRRGCFEGVRGVGWNIWIAGCVTETKWNCLSKFIIYDTDRTNFYQHKFSFRVNLYPLQV